MKRVHQATFAQLDVMTLYALLRLRIDVFVVEQQCPYPELDGRDTEPGTRHLWVADDAGPAAYLRVLAETGGGRRIGRVCTRAGARGSSLAATLMRAALEIDAAATIVLDAQSHLSQWYQRFGFEQSGEPFVEDGIPHVPMRRAPHTVES